jgi:flagellar motility protein MotE (MotC chaperone)
MEVDMRSTVLLVPLFLTFASGAALAEDDRYLMEKSGDSFVRMDRKTGEMSTCRQDGDALVCKLAADERTAYQDEIDRLQQSLDALDQRVVTLENSLTNRLESTLPSEEEFNKTLSYMERFMRSFMDIAKDLGKDDDADNPPASPQKT